MGPCLRMANFSGRLRERKGRREIIGRRMSVTRELAQALNAAARLVCVSAGCTWREVVT